VKFLVPFLAFSFLMVGFSAAGEPVDLDDVYCALCHYEEGDAFAQSVHYQRGLMLCNDCHGGLLFEADEEIAKAPGSGFIGKPGREQIAAVCSQCHSGPAGFFARGPHREWQNENNPTCITCHHNHLVVDASLALMDETCATCHAAGSGALQVGEQIRAVLEENQDHLDQVRAQLDSLAALDPSLQRALPYLDEARVVLQEAAPITHALEVGLIEERAGEFRGAVGRAEAFIADYFQEREWRRWAVLLIWVFVAANVALLWWRGRQPV
jgi:hypothetical protein